MKILLWLLLAGISFSESLRTELTAKDGFSFAGNPAAQGRYEFEDLMEAANILMDKEEYIQAQEVLELALYLRPRELRIFQMLAKVYEKTGQSDKQLALAESVAEFILPEGIQDPFYERMLTISIILNSKKDEATAWRNFLRLYEGLSGRQGRQYELIRELEKEAHVPFLSRVYDYLLQRRQYGDFRWGQLGDYFLYIGEFEKAKKYLELELQKPGFDRIFLFSYARILYDRKQFTDCQVYLNVARQLATTDKFREKIEQLQYQLRAWAYEYGMEQVRQEADLLIRFREVDQGIKKLKELFLVGKGQPRTYYQVGAALLTYPADRDTYAEGAKIMLEFARLLKEPSDDVITGGELLLKAERLDELAAFLQILKQRFPRQFAEDPKFSTLVASITTRLLDNADILIRNKADDELLRRYLNSCRELNPTSVEVYARLFTVLERIFLKELSQRQFLSAQSAETAARFGVWIEQDALRAHSDLADLYYFAGRILSMRPKREREYARELGFLRRALEIEPAYHQARLQIAANYFDFGYAMQAYEALLVLLEAKGVDTATVQAAKEFMVKACRINAESAFAQASYFTVVAQMEKAIAVLDNQLLDLESTLWLAYSYQAADAFQKNAELLTKAVKKYPDQAELWYLKALSHQGLIEYEAAIAAYDQALALKKDSPAKFFSACEENRDSLKRILELKGGVR